MNPVSLDASQALWSIQWILQSSRGSEQDCKICVGVRCTMCCIIAHECYMNGMSQAAPHPYSSQFPIHVFQWDFFFPPQGGSHKAEKILVWSGSETQTNRKDGEKETWGPPPTPRASVGGEKKNADERETKPGCSVAMATATCQSAFLWNIVLSSLTSTHTHSCK